MAALLDDESDVRLLARFAVERDEPAFAKVVARHGPLVYRVALRMMRQREDAEDVFQAVFMVLARRAASWRGELSLAGWLHGVTVRVGLNQRKTERRRRRHTEALMRTTKEEAPTNDTEATRWVVDEQLAELPARFREVIVLCDLEGKAQQEVAKQLALPLGTVSSRLARGREQLRKRLARQGVCVAALGSAACFAGFAEAAASVPEALLKSTVRHADAFVRGGATAKATMSLHITTLADGALRAMMITRYKSIACLLAIIAVSMFGGALAPDFVPEVLGVASADTTVFDDFSDRDAMDGIPASWRPFSERGLDNGDVDASSGDLVLSPHNDESVLVAVLEPALSLATTSIRSRIRSGGGIDDEPGNGHALLARIEDEHAYQAGISMRGMLYIGANPAPDDGGGFVLLATTPSAFLPAAEDVVLQFDAVGDTLQLFAWRPGESRPTTPQVEVNSTLYPSGNIGILYDPPTGNGTATYRSIRVADTVPEPGSRTLCAVGSGLLVAGLLYGRRRQLAR